jgi:hypothetical protein
MCFRTDTQYANNTLFQLVPRHRNSTRWSAYPFIVPARGKYVADHISGAKYVELPGRNVLHFVEPWRPSFQEIAEFLTGQRAEVADDRVLATVLFTDIVDSTRRPAEIGTVTGMHCMMRTTPSSGRNSPGFGVAR